MAYESFEPEGDNPRTNTPDPKKIHELWTEGTNRRSRFDEHAYRNIAFIEGEQFLVFDRNTRRFYNPSADGRTRLPINLIMPIWRTEVAKIVKSKPIVEVVPSTEAEDDRTAAKVAQRILKSELHRIGMQTLLQDLYNWVFAIGTAHLHPYWNKFSKNIEIDIVPHIELVLDPAAKRSTQQAMWAIHGRQMTCDEAYEAFGREFKPSSSGETPAVWTNISQITKGSWYQTKKDSVLVLRCWHRPSRRHPKGALYTIIGDEIVENIEEFPFDHKQLPFIDFHDVRLPGRFDGRSTVQDLINPQKDYNQSRSRTAEARALLVSNKMIAPEGSMDADRLTTEAGEIVYFRPVGPYKPEVMQVPNLPPHVFQTEQAAVQEMQDISGQHEVSRGQTPGSGIPASAIAMLQESDDTKLGPITSRLEEGLSRFGSQILGLVQQYWTTQRAVQTWSEDDGEPIIERFKGSDINGQLDVQTVPGSALPRSAAQQRQDILALWDRRILTDPRQLLKYLDLPEVDTILSNMSLDSQQAKREHLKMQKGMPVIAELWHSHEAHILEHNDWRKTVEFEKLPDDIRAALADHVHQHEELIQQQMIKMMMEQAGMGMGMPMEGEAAGGSAPAGGAEAPMGGGMPSTAPAGPTGPEQIAGGMM